MKGQRGKKGKYVIFAKRGLINDDIWNPILKNYETSLICKIRKRLKKINGLTEKFNSNSRYFGYCIEDDKDRVYIYVQKKNIRIDLYISPIFKKDILREDKYFTVNYVNNYQGRAQWLTGWHVPHDTKKMSFVIKLVKKALKGTYNQEKASGQ